ncbi:uncharacterized protein METZ01_LOCUS276158, partial [marine metagenome]
MLFSKQLTLFVLVGQPDTAVCDRTRKCMVPEKVSNVRQS